VRPALGSAASRLSAAGLAICAILPLASHAHESRPAYLELTERTPGLFDVSWRRPARGEMVLRLQPVFPGHCGERSQRITVLRHGASLERWQIDCGATGLLGHSILIDGLTATITDALIRVTLRSGVSYSQIVRGNAPAFALEGEPSVGQVVRDYGLLGVEHILGGIDHLLFVFALLLLVDGTWVLVKTITAFTVAHSVTLGAATLGFVEVPQAPVEAVIALSILFLATELVKRLDGASDLAMRAPWIVAFVFGLLHGFGFAGALAEVGLPRTDIPLALLAFNLGVEAGQLSFVAVVLLARRVAAPSAPYLASWLPRATACGIGITAAYWFAERVRGFW
jgi:hydrogenase/urease accessory protein HupE